MKGIPPDMDAPDLGMPMDMAMPDFSGIGKMLKLLSWLPAILTGLVMFVLSFLAQVVYHGLTQYDYNMTYGAFMMMVFISLVISLVTSALVKMAAGKKMKQQSFF